MKDLTQEERQDDKCKHCGLTRDRHLLGLRFFGGDPICPPAKRTAFEPSTPAPEQGDLVPAAWCREWREVVELTCTLMGLPVGSADECRQSIAAKLQAVAPAPEQGLPKRPEEQYIYGGAGYLPSEVRAHWDALESRDVERLKRIAELEVQLEDQADQLHRITTWCEAYPVEVFVPVSSENMKRAHGLLESEGISLGAISAVWARHLLSGIAKIAAPPIEQESGEKQ